MGTTGGDGGDIGVDSAQLLLVGICIFGLIAAAFLAPVVGAGGLGGDGPGEGDGRNEGEDGTDGDESTGESTTPGGELDTDEVTTTDGDGSDGEESERREVEGDDTRWVTDQNGTRWRVEENGTRWVSDEDGARRVIETNGTVRVVERNGTRWVSDRNGSRWVATENGTRYIVGENGTRYIVGEEGKRRPVDANDTRWPADRGPPFRLPQTGCVAVVSDNPRPGTRATVTVTVDTRPAAGVRVWFNDRFVGRTGDGGAVTGTVPFVTELNVTVESPTDEPCRFPRRGDEPADETVVGTGSAAAVGMAGAAPVAGVTAAAGAPTPVRPTRAVQSRGGTGVNNSTRYDLPSEVTIRVIGEPIAGSTVTLNATVAGVPMPDATVTVNGTRVGRTEGNGRYELTVPDRQAIEVGVSRGEIRGNTTIGVPQLSVRFVPRLVVPGERATVVVTRDGEPVENATVALDGQRLGTTGPNGTATVALPLSVSGTVTAAVGPQSAAVPLWLAYWLTGAATLVLGFLTTVTTATAARVGGRGTAKRVAAVWAGVWTLFAGYVVGERLGLAVAGIAILLVALYRYRRALASGGATTAGLVAAFVQWCSRAALWVVGALETLADWGRAGAARLAAWLRSLPTSLSGLATRLAAWLGRVPGRLGATLRSLPLRVVVAVVATVAVVAAATYTFEERGFLVSTALVVLAAVGWWLWQREPTAPSGESASEPATGPEDSAEGAAVPTLRQLWRRLASWVLPDTWQTSTPAEVSRAAIERGLPRGPVETLTEAFRDVEYGGQPEEGRQARARAAFEAVEAAREEEDG